MTDAQNKPLAVSGLTSYRYKGRYGWIMIGASNHHDALREVLRSTSGPAMLADLEVWHSLRGCYVPAGV